MDLQQRLSDETEELFENGFPTKCQKFDELLNNKLLASDIYGLIRHDVRTSCQTVRASKIEEEKIRLAKNKGFYTGDGELDAEDNEMYYSASSGMLSEKGRKRKMKYEKNDSDEEDLTIMECNKHIEAVIDVLKPEMRNMIECCNIVKTWMQLQIPEIQDGNNFGVEVQEEILEEVRRVEGDAEGFLKTISLYHLTRAEIVSKFAKYPHVEDYIFAIEELDIKKFSTLRMMTLELRNYCLSVVDLFIKNKEKIFKPRGRNNSTSLIY